MTTARGPARATVEGRAYLDLQNLARRQRRPTDELQQLYALEGFLGRLASSAQADTFVLKGGVLLAAYDARRPTRDIDVQVRAVTGNLEEILGLVRQIAAVPAEDGLVFDTDAASAEIIRDEDEYNGIRVTLTATLATAKLSLHVDVNIGDPIWPAPRAIELPRLLGGTITLIGYPLAMVYAEKIVTALQRGTINPRWRDFADVYLLAARHPITGADLHRALSEVAAYRQVAVSPLTDAIVGYADLAQGRWAAWRRKQHLDDRLPSSFRQVLEAFIAFADPRHRRRCCRKVVEPGRTDMGVADVEQPCRPEHPCRGARRLLRHVVCHRRQAHRSRVVAAVAPTGRLHAIRPLNGLAVQDHVRDLSPDTARHRGTSGDTRERATQ